MNGDAEIETADARRFLASFICPDPKGDKAPCRRVAQDDIWKRAPRIELPDETVVSCPVWLDTKCRHYEVKYRDWLQLGRRRGIPERFLEASVNAPRRTLALDAAAAFVRDAARRGRALVLIGDKGVGKTWAECAAVHAWPESLNDDGDPFYVSVAGLVRDLMHWDSRDPREHPFDVAMVSSFLALDDLGVGHLKADGYAASALEELLHSRHAALRPTIVTTNWSVSEMRQRLSARTIDRFVEWADVVELSGLSLRSEDPA